LAVPILSLETENLLLLIATATETQQQCLAYLWNGERFSSPV